MIIREQTNSTKLLLVVVPPQKTYQKLNQQKADNMQPVEWIATTPAIETHRRDQCPLKLTVLCKIQAFLVYVINPIREKFPQYNIIPFMRR